MRADSSISRVQIIIALAILAIVVIGFSLTYAFFLATTNTTTTVATITSGGGDSSSNSNTVIVGTGSSSSENSKISASSDWLTYHKDSSRSGFDPSEPLAKSPSPNWKSKTLDGAIYAEPLVVSGKGLVVVATENDSVYALNETNGQILWRENLGQPVPGSGLPCGDINPSGITGTPVIDSATNEIYVVDFLRPGEHEFFALNLDTGSIVFQRNVDPPGVSPLVEQQRGALALSNGTVYVPYGGLDGDCGDYHGFVIGVPVSNGVNGVSSVGGGSTGAGSENTITNTNNNGDSSGQLLSYQVPTGREGGIWAPSGVSVDASGNIYVATGNSAANTNFDFGDALIRLSPNLSKVVDYFAPTNWASLNTGDTDLGSVGPAILEGNNENNNTIFQIGKEGIGYLLNASHLGGIGGEEFSARVCSGSAGAYGGIAYSSPYLYVPCTNGIVALEVHLSSPVSSSADSIPSFTKVWSGPAFTAGPPIVAGGAVWVLDTGSGKMYALNATTGSTIFSYAVGSVAHFSTPSSAEGRVFVGAGDSVEAFLI